MAAVRILSSTPKPRVAWIALVAAAATLLAAAGSAFAGSPKTPNASAVSQYVEMVPSARGAGPSSARAVAPATKPRSAPKARRHSKPHKAARAPEAASPVSAAFGTDGGGLGGGALLAVILGSITVCGIAALALRRRLNRS